MDVKEFCKEYATERRGSDCLKWDMLEKRFGDKDLLAMWVADMEFKCPDAVLQAIHKRVEHGVFGYSYVTDKFCESFLNWQKARFAYDIKREWIRFTPGIVAGLYWLVNAFTQPKESVMILTPVYYPFQNAVRDCGRTLVTCDLVNDNGHYTMDYDAIEKSIVENDVKMSIFCSPHNPVGRVWEEGELIKFMQICKKYNVLVVSDEIHQDIVFENNKQIPLAALDNAKYNNQIITAVSASKTFNLAGLPVSELIISNEKLRTQYDDYAKTVNHTETNILALTASGAAYEHGANWVEGLLNVIWQNYSLVKEQLNAHTPEIVIAPLEGTYLMWLDLRSYIKPEDIKHFATEICKIAIDYGEWFAPNMQGFIRINLATTPENVKTTVERIIAGINNK